MNATPNAATLTRLAAALAVALGLVVAGMAVGQGLERFRAADRSVTVKGLAEKDVPADFAVWTLSFRRAGNDFASVQKELAADRERVAGFLAQQGFKPDEIELRPLQVEDLLARDYAQANQPLRYNGVGRVLVKSARAPAIEAAAKAVDPLIQAGVPLAGEQDGSSAPRYQLRGLNAVKGPLLAEATRNAREQAEKFASEAGAELGRLKSANQGVISLSADDGSDGDHSPSRVKRLRVVSTFTYELR